MERRTTIGTKDIIEKQLEDYDDVFADIVNVLLFDGRRLVRENQLENAKDRSMFKADGNLHEQERDASKFWKEANVRIALYGLENQTEIDVDMPLRVYSYDGAAYKQQLLSGVERYPVVTLVLYFGEKRWNKARNLHGCFSIPGELKSYVNDGKINLFEIAYLTDEQVNMFQSDFRIVADFFVQERKNKSYKPSQKEIIHVEEVLKMMSVLTNDVRFEEVYSPSEGGVRTMCEILDKIEQEGIQKGLSRGIHALLECGFSKEEIAQKLDISEETIEEILSTEGESPSGA